MVNLLGFNVLNLTKSQYLDLLLEKIKNKKKTIIISGNPEVLNFYDENRAFELDNETVDIIPDGVGVLLAGKFIGKEFSEKIAGVEVVEGILKQSSKSNIEIFLLGAEEAIVNEAVRISREKYNALISGYNNGFFDLENCEDIIEKINNSGAAVLFVAMGCPRQEKFIFKYKDKLETPILMGVGGSFDILAGKVDRAPEWMIKLGLEWSYRVVKEPVRIKRLGSIPKFLYKVLVRQGLRNAK